MLKMTKKYTDFNGNERTEDLYFNFTDAELTEMEFSAEGGAGLEEMINKLVSEQNLQKIIEMIKDVVLRAYGEKSLDGRRFAKNDEIRASFAETQAYSDLFMLLSTDADKAAEFINGCLSKKMVIFNDAPVADGKNNQDNTVMHIPV